jgi:tetratricopeptide (TPR) repeat protein
MSQELIIHFNSPTQFTVRYEEGETQALTFVSPITDTDYQDMRWYLETYSSSYTASPDEDQAQRIGQQLPTWGEALFKAVFADSTAQSLFRALQEEAEKRYVTISAVFPEILGLPWELLKDPHGVYLFNEHPRIAIRRSLRTAGGRRARKVKTKESVRLLFIISRPDGAGFIDPRVEAQAVVAALAKNKIEGQVQVEFLRQATLDALLARLENEELPPVDIVHFDGHGVFDGSGQLGNSGKVVTIARPYLKASATAANMGYLLFEDDKGEAALVSAEVLGEMLQQQQVSMMVLSACQSAKVAGEDALGSVAARLVRAGMPSVVAMTHSVLVKTTELLFQDFYAQLANGQGVGEALENARRYLFRHPGRGTRCYGEREVKLELQDWFIPSLYQTGADVALLTKKKSPGAEDSRAALENWGNLPSLQEAGFFGRAWELWELERWFLQGARRVTIAGFGGQGKTYLAIELGQWLWQKGWFAKAVFVDYKAFQGVDAVGYAVSSVAVVLGENLLDAQAARVALGKVSTLVILDNLESLAPALLQELLTVAAQWSQIGETRVLLTTRQLTDFAHPEFPAAGSLKHRVLSLDGLRAEDAVAYYQRLMTLPPAMSVRDDKRSEKQLKELFRLVQCHPLSINLLAQLLKTQRLERLEKRLDQLVAASPDNLVLASLQLSLERLDKEAQQWLPLLGVFQGGAFEDDLLAITEIPPATWPQLRPLLEAAGLIKVEHLTNIGVPYLQFHPTLAPALWSRLDRPQQQTLRQRYQQRYYALSGYLYFEDKHHPLEARAIVKHELSNLLSAVKGALAEATDYAVDFVKCVNWFLECFGLQRDRAALTQQAAKLAGEVGSRNWYLSKSGVGTQLFSAGHYTEAAQVFQEILNGLGTAASYDRCQTLGRLGRCFSEQGQAPQAIVYYQQELAILQQLEQTQGVQREIGTVYTDLADALTKMGSYTEAKRAYEQSLEIDQKTGGDSRGEAVTQGQLGTLALLQGNLAEAEQRYQAALASFQNFNEPGTEAIYWHQLGVVYEKAQQWEAAERAYRQAAHLEEAQGHLQGAAQTWNQLATVTRMMGKGVEAEAWYRKAIEVDKQFGNAKEIAGHLNNLADLLQNQPDRLTEARQLAEQALGIKQTLDPATAEIWTTYNILAQIADKQGDAKSAKDYRRLARSAKANFAGTRYELKRKYSELILAVVREEKVEVALTSYGEGWDNLKTAIQQIVAGERDKERLCEPLSFGDAPIVYAILDGLAEPGSLKWLEEEEK